MKSGLRGLIVSILLFVLWGTVIAGPFRYLAYAFKSLVSGAFATIGIKGTASGFLMPVILVIITVIYLLISARKSAEYMAGLGAAISIFYYLFICFKNRSFDGLAFPVALGLAVALIFILMHFEKGNLWLGDAYFYAIPVMLFYELVMVPLYRILNVKGNPLNPFIQVPTKGMISDIGDLLGIPMIMWGVFVFILLLLPILYFSKERKNG